MGEGSWTEGSDAYSRVRMMDASGQSMGRSIGQMYILPESEEDFVLYKESHVMFARAGVRHARLTCLGSAAKPEAVAVCPRLLYKVISLVLTSR
jgi:hypothetical protein